MVGMVVSTRQKSTPEKSHAATYPWELWFSRRVFKLVHGQHFNCTLSGMTTNVRQAARRHGIRVRIDQGWTDLTITVKGPNENK